MEQTGSYPDGTLWQDDTSFREEDRKCDLYVRRSDGRHGWIFLGRFNLIQRLSLSASVDYDIL